MLDSSKLVSNDQTNDVYYLSGGTSTAHLEGKYLITGAVLVIMLAMSVSPPSLQR